MMVKVVRWSSESGIVSNDKTGCGPIGVFCGQGSSCVKAASDRFPSDNGGTEGTNEEW